jgi:hypothetical protein
VGRLYLQDLAAPPLKETVYVEVEKQVPVEVIVKEFVEVPVEVQKIVEVPVEVKVVQFVEKPVFYEKAVFVEYIPNWVKLLLAVQFVSLITAIMY